MSVLSESRLHDEAAAFRHLESILWADGITCPHCGVVDGRVYELKGVRTKPSAKHPNGVERFGLRKCGECRKQFTVKVGTCFEHARIPLHKMLQAVSLMMASKKGISSHQLGRILEIQYNSAWFLAHRIRLAMENGELANFGSAGGIVEVDETFIGRLPDRNLKQGTGHKMKVLSMVDRDTGHARSQVIESLQAQDIVPPIMQNLSPRARLMTDEARHYGGLGKRFADHQTVNHKNLEFARGEFHTNTVEGFFSVFKRGMKGVYQHCQKKHLHRYLAEFDFRYTYRVKNGYDDRARAVEGLRGISGKRLTYKQATARVA